MKAEKFHITEGVQDSYNSILFIFLYNYELRDIKDIQCPKLIFTDSCVYLRIF